MGSTLPNAIADELGVGDKIRLEWKATKIVKKTNNEDNEEFYEATFDTPGGTQLIKTKTIVSTVPAHSIGTVLESVMPESKDIFNRVRDEIDRIGVNYPPVLVIYKTCRDSVVSIHGRKVCELLVHFGRHHSFLDGHHQTTTCY